MSVSLENLEQNLVALAEEYGKAILDGHSKAANSAHSRLTKLLRSSDPTTRKSFLPPLCQHSNVSVRLWAATYLLDVDEALALSTLAACVQDRSALGLTAEVTLDMWKCGSLKL